MPEFALSPDRGVVAPSRRITTSSAGHGGPPRRTLRSSLRCSLPVRELVAQIPAPRCDHRKNEDPALVEKFLVSVRIALADLFGHMGEVEFNRPTTTRLEVYEQRPILRVEHVAWVRLAVQQLLGGSAVADRSSQAS